MRATMQRTIAAVLAGLATLVGVAVFASAQPRSRMDPGAREILAHRLSTDGLHRAEAVMRAMDQVPSRGPEAPRADVAMVTVLNMAFAYNEPWRDAILHDNVRSIEGGQPDLAAAIRSAGMSTQDYVLTHMTLLLAYPVAAQRRQGRAVNVTDVAPENVAWVEANWGDVERFMNELRHPSASGGGLASTNSTASTPLSSGSRSGSGARTTPPRPRRPGSRSRSLDAQSSPP